MRKLLIAVAIAVLLGLAASAYLLKRRLQSPGTKQVIFEAVRERLGSEVEVGNMELSLWDGLKLRKVRVANPPPFHGAFLATDEIILRHRLLPLLGLGLNIDRLQLDAPKVTLVRRTNNRWNYQAFLDSKNGSAEKPQNALAAVATQVLDIHLSRMHIQDAEVAIVDQQGELLADLRNLNLTSSLSLAGEELSGKGNLQIESFNAGNSLYLRRMSAPLQFSERRANMDPIEGRVGGGRLSSRLRLELSPSFKFQTHLRVTDVDVAALLQEARVKESATGTLHGHVFLSGSGGLATATGKGRVEVTQGRLEGVPLLRAVATVLQAPSLQDLEFEEALVEFSLAHNRLETEVIRLVAKDLQLTGKGTLLLSNKHLDHELRLTLRENAVGLLSKPLLALLERTEDGSRILDFRVWGPFESPQTDIRERLARLLAKPLLDKTLRLFD